ncbi:MAG: hypothetical protein WAW36_02665 [Methylovulum miyakonense]|uniref:hypothetical protein n=1 Tax=Methylovulum miyakonense TaxID=645578 RepID=UPI003BB6F2E5
MDARAKLTLFLNIHELPRGYSVFSIVFMWPMTFLIIYFQQTKPTIDPDAKKNGSALKYFCQNEGSGGCTSIPSSGILTKRKQSMTAVKEEPPAKYSQFDILN